MNDRPLLNIGDRDPAVLAVRRILRGNGYDVAVDGGNLDVLDELLISQVEVFQMQHLGPDGLFLPISSQVDEATWWALDNPSGAPQRSGLEAPRVAELTPNRSKFLDWLAAEHAVPVFEVPDGSNRHARIDHYFKPTGLLGLAWCMAFVSSGLREVLGRDPLGSYFVGVQKYVAAARELGWIVEQPKPGDQVAWIKSKGQGHIAAVNGVSEDDKTIGTCGGNEGNRVKVGRRAREGTMIFIDPWQDGQSLDFTRIPNAAATIGPTEGTR